MDIDTLRLYEIEFLNGGISADHVVTTLSGARLPPLFPSFDKSFLALLTGQVHRKTDVLLKEDYPVFVRPEQGVDRETTRLYLEAFDREVRCRSRGLGREHSCSVLETPEQNIGGALWYYFDTTRKRGIELYIDRLYVPKEYRGRKYGQYLVEETIAQEGALCTGALLVAPENVLGFYTKLHFRVQFFAGNREFALMYREL